MKIKREMTNIIFAMFFGLLVITASNQAFALDGIWETKAPMPTVRWGAAGGVINGKLYVAGGTGTGVNSLATLEVYDPGTNTWATKASMTTARNNAASGVINGKLYVVGGDIAQSQKLTTLEVYDPATDTWTTKASMLTPRSGPGAVAIDGKLYVTGGCLGWCAPVTNVLEVYDPANDTWSTKAPLPTARGVADIAEVNGIFYVMGGCCGGVSSESDLMSRTVEAYNPMTNTWTTKIQHLVGANDTMGSINGKIYVAKFAVTEIYDPATDTWAFLAPMVTARQYAAGGVINGKLYVAGGYDGAAGSATLETFTPLTCMTCIGDVNGDGKIGFAEASSALQVLSGLRFSGCNQPIPVEGICGSSNGGVFTTAPSTGLCNAGSATSITGTGPWSWSCSGTNGGSTASCAATLPVIVEGICGSSNGGVFTTAPSTGLCNAGSATSITGTGPWSWSCSGTNGGSTASCAASLTGGGIGIGDPAIEVWVGSNGQGDTNTILTKDASGTITTTGQWTYDYQGAIVTCVLSAGNMTVTGTNVTLTSTGTATNPAAPAGYQTSSFTLFQTGTMSGGQGSGTATITFHNPYWPPPNSGNWTAQRQSGSGVTN